MNEAETLPPIPPQITSMTPAQRALSEMLGAARHPDGWGLKQLDMSAVQEFRQRQRAETGVAYTSLDIIVRALALTLANEPQFNVLADDSKFFQYEGIDIGVSVASSTPTAPVVVLRGVEKLPLLEVHRQRVELSREAVAQTEKNLEMLGRRVRFLPANIRRVILRRFMHSAAMRHKFAGTVQVTAIELSATDWFFPAHIASSLMVSWGGIELRPHVVDGHLEVRPTINLGISIDQRVIHIVRLARMMVRFERYLNAPEKLL